MHIEFHELERGFGRMILQVSPKSGARGVFIRVFCKEWACGAGLMMRLSPHAHITLLQHRGGVRVRPAAEQTPTDKNMYT